MQNTLSAKTFITETGSREPDMRDILANMEELACMIGIKGSGGHCEILSIEPPGASGHGSLNHPADPDKGYPPAGKSRVLPFRKK